MTLPPHPSSVPPSDPASQYPTYPAGPPPAGYSVPFMPQPGYDPLISPDYSGWWQRGMAIVKAGWPQLASLQAIGVVVGLVVQVPLLVYISVWGRSLIDRANSPDVGTAPEVDLGPFFVAIGLTLLGVLFSVIVSAAITVATMHLGVSIASGATRSVGASARHALRRALPMVGWEFVAGLIVLVGLCLCVLPALYPVAVFTILPAVVAFERTNAIGRCFNLFNRSFGVAAGRVATILGIGLAAGVLASIIGGVIDRAAGVPGGFGLPVRSADVSAGVQIAAGISSTAVSVLFGAAVAVLTGPLTLLAYADLRARVEPLTTQVLVNELET